MASITINDNTLFAVMKIKRRYNFITYKFKFDQPLTKQTFIQAYQYGSSGLLSDTYYTYESIIMFIESYPGLKEVVTPGLLQVYKEAFKLVKEEYKKQKKMYREQEQKRLLENMCRWNYD
jgi:hypothetical protein